MPHPQATETPADAGYAAPARHHETTFQRHRLTGQLHAECTCGWTMTGDAGLVYGRAATHDLDMVLA